MYVDYLRAYKLKDGCNQSINTCNYNFSNYDNKIKSLINIGGNGCTNAVSSSSTTYLHASEYIQFSGDFTVPIGATFFADANGNCSNGAIDYHCSYVLNSCNYNFSGYGNETKTRIQLGGTGCSAIINSGNNVSLKAIETIELKNGFQADYGSITEMVIVTCQ